MRYNKSGLLWKLLLPVPVVLVVSMLAAGFLVPRYIADSTRQDAINSATQTVRQFKALRAYYTEQVIQKALASGALTPSVEHNGADEIPLPATMIHEMSRILTNQELSINLYSAFPFPNRSERQLDNFQKQAWAYLTSNPDATFTRQERQRGQEIIRVAIADRMVADTCVSCHNSHPLSPKLDWKLGDVRGVLEIHQVIEAQLGRGQSLSNRILLVLLLGGMLISTILVVLVRRHVMQPLAELTESAQRVSQGDLNARVEGGSTHEVAALANAFNLMAGNLSEKERRESRHLKQLSEAADINEEVGKLCRHVAKVAAGDLASQLETPDNADLADLANNLNSMTACLAGISSDILRTADVVNDSVDRVETAMSSQSEIATRQARTSDRSAGTLQQLCNSVDASVRLASRLGQSATLTRKQGAEGLTSVQAAVIAAQEMHGEIEDLAHTILSLSNRAQEIGVITDTVRRLAQQSRILAFNASVEAAKAGEAGKGFAVVAEEVRLLASQSDQATRQVKQLLESILGETDRAVMATERGNKSVDKTITLIQDAGDSMLTLTEVIDAAARSSEEIVDAVQAETKEIHNVQSEINGFRTDTQQMVASAENALAAVKELRAVTRMLKEKTGVYRL